MTTKISLFVTAAAIMSLTACGLQTGESVTSGNPPDATTAPQCTADADCPDGQVCNADNTCAPASDPSATDTLPAPFKSPAACVLDFSERYVSGATCGEVRGTMPLMTWDSGMSILDSDGSGYMGMSFDSTLPAGTYVISYVGYQDCDGGTPHDAWAQFGHEEDLNRMSPDALAYIQCNWYDAKTGQYLNDVQDPHCNIRINVDDQCNITPAGNMGGFTGN